MARKDKEQKDIRYPDQKIVISRLEEEMSTSFIDYAMSVIVSRALPDVRDGLKPVHRRILYSMYEDNLTSDRPFRKSATAVGNVLGRYHPHGDASVYDALVRLAQDFSMRYILVDGHGNFGSVDGDPPAAYRYTEARMSKISNEMLRDIDKDTVDWDPNYDETRKEPKVVPSRFPNLLVNGSSGIAVGMTTNIPPHNLREVIDAVICVLNNSEADLDDIMEHIKGPDFPTKGIIMGHAGIRAAYATGKGKVHVRARTELEEMSQGRTRIVVTELPYQVNKARLIESIAEHVKNKRIEGISGLRDESDRDGMRVVIELKRDTNAQVVLNRLYATTQMQTTFAIVLLALVENQTQPKILSLKQILDEYIAFQKEVLVRRTQYDRRKAMERAHILEGLRIAVDNIDEVIRIIRSSYNDARERLMERFNLSEIQAQAILEMQLRRLQGLERDKIESEYQELLAKIAYYDSLLADEELMKGVLIDELTEIRDKFGDDRRTEIAAVEDEIDIEDLIDEEECVYTLTHGGYIKRMPANTYRAQRRGGRGITAMTTREEDYVETVFTASTHDYILFFTNYGRAYRKKGYMIPEAGRQARGTNIVNILQLQPGEKVSAMIRVRDFDDESVFLVFVTRDGTVKRMHMSELKNIRNVGIRAITLDEEDELISVRETDGSKKILIATHDGMAICFCETDLRPMGRMAAGVRGIRLRTGDYCVGAARTREGGSVLTVTEKGYGKRTPIDEYLRGVACEGEEKAAQSRGGLGLRNYNITDKTGKVADVKIVDDNDDVLIISDDGTIIRMAATDISTYSRATQGVRLMRIGEDARVISIARTDKEDETGEDTPASDSLAEDNADENPPVEDELIDGE
jgi:DNA gyrase subunit A